ncbi:MurR/RpiR family transcriptional regulator [Synergistes jonesii]|uniref:MurR/RpiR family transcriptional regulator n=1 Tax=Synergistes jonesii TaxID=2754 RepID=UPI00248E240E|nr:MurR/RpiR family transcriptional regulator [Synergistes jonesii]
MIDDKITEAMPNLTKKQAMLGRYICENKYAVALMNAPMIAKEAGVSEATLTRFVYSLGYSSFSEFLLDLRRETQEANANNPFRQERYGRKDRPVYKRVFDLERNLMDETLNAINPEVFDRCVGKIVEADRILLIGCPPHKFLTEYFANFLTIFHDNVTVVQSLDMPFFGTLESTTEKTVAVVFSYPRYPVETQKMVETVANRGLTVIGITDSKFSPIIRYCTHYLITPQRYLIVVDPNAAAITLLHAMLVAIYQKNETEIKKRLKRYEKTILATDMFVFKDYNFTSRL